MALIRTLLRGRSRLHLFGVDAYAGAKGGDELFALIDGQKPKVVLMQSFAVGDSEVRTGGVVPYRSLFHPAGLERAVAAVADPGFRSQWTCEAVGVLAALRVGAEVRFVDRLHNLSFDRLVSRSSVDEIRVQVGVATEAVVVDIQGKPGGMRDLPPDALSPYWPELWAERHAIMSHVTQQVLAEEEQSDVCLVIGAKHVGPVKSRIEVDAFPTQEEVKDLLAPPADDAAWEVELEKRSALAALLASTQSFPVAHVLPDSDSLLPAALEIVKRFYPKYSAAIRGRLTESSSLTSEKLQAEMSTQTYGLQQLEQLCLQFAPTDMPSTPPPPPKAKT